MTVRPIHPLALAQFMSMEGAADLVEAFATIPEGPMRQSIVQLAMTTAATYQASIIPSSPAAKPQAALPPARKGPQTNDNALKAVKLMLEGSSPAQTAEALGLDIKAVLAARKTAKRHGTTFPKVRMAAKVIELHPRKTKSKAGKKSVGVVRFPVSMEELSPRGLLGLQATARVLGMTPELLMLKKAEAVKLFNQGVTGAAAGAQLGIPQKMIENWKTVARQAGLVPPAHQAEAV